LLVLAALAHCTTEGQTDGQTDGPRRGHICDIRRNCDYWCCL